MIDLKEKTIRGGGAKICSQAANFIIRVGALMVLGRLLGPKDFGIVGMVTAILGIANTFKDFGLSAATIQRDTVTEEQLSTLFWINMLVGAVLGLLSLAAAPFVAAFYREPGLFAITAALAAGFLLTAAGVQHSAILQRQMRFTASAIVELISLIVSTAVGIGMAMMGYGYWALVGMMLTAPAVNTLCTWLITAWVPGLPRKQVGIGSMMHYGGTMSLNGLVVYLAYNLDKVLLGRFWGAEALGLYGRAYQLINIPTDNLNSAVGGVAFSALSRLQNEPDRLKSYFLKGYALVIGLTLPITIVCALFASDLIAVVLGPKWKDTVTIFRVLSPTILVFALINPLGWLLFSLGLVGRSLRISMVITPVVFAGCLIGLPFGPEGVACGYSSMMILWIVPHTIWCLKDTMISPRDIALAASKPLVSGAVAGSVLFVLQLVYGGLLNPLARILLEGGGFMSIYICVLFYVMGQKAFYVDLLRALTRRATGQDARLASA